MVNRVNIAYCNHHFPYKNGNFMDILHFQPLNLEELGPINSFQLGASLNTAWNACHGSWTVRSQSQSRVGSLRRRGVGEGNLPWVKHKPQDVKPGLQNTGRVCVCVIFPTCQVRVSRFYIWFYQSSRLLPAGPQPRTLNLSGHCRTSTASDRTSEEISDRMLMNAW